MSKRSNMPWFRVYSEVLNDRKIKRVMKDTGLIKVTIVGFWTVILAMAGQSIERGKLKIADDLWISPEEIAEETGLELEATENILREFILLGMLTQVELGFEVTHWDDRQFKSDRSADRMENCRQKDTLGEREETKPSQLCDGGDTHGMSQGCHSDSVRVSQERHSDGIEVEVESPEVKGESSEKEVEEEVESFNSDSYFWEKIPKTPFEASKHPAIQVFYEVASRIGAIGQYKAIIDSERLILSRLECGRTGLIITLKPFYKEWRSRKNANGQPYDPNGIAWLTEWAVNNKIPPKPAKKNVPDHLLDDEARREKYQAPWMASEQEDDAEGSGKPLNSWMSGEQDNNTEGSQETSIEASAEISEEIPIL